MTDVALVCEEHDPLDGSVHGQLTCSKDVFDLAGAERLAGNLQVEPLLCFPLTHLDLQDLHNPRLRTEVCCILRCQSAHSILGLKAR